MNIIHATGIEGAREARGTVVVIDVLRSFTVSAYALAGGARECRLVKTVAEARALAARIPGAVVSAEEDALPGAGFPPSDLDLALTADRFQFAMPIKREYTDTDGYLRLTASF